MKSKTIDINGTRFIIGAGNDEVTLAIGPPDNVGIVLVNMTKEQCSTLGDMLKIMSGQMREHSI